MSAPLRLYDFGVNPDVVVGPGYEDRRDHKVHVGLPKNGEWLNKGDLTQDPDGHARYSITEINSVTEITRKRTALTPDEVAERERARVRAGEEERDRARAARKAAKEAEKAKRRAAEEAERQRDIKVATARRERAEIMRAEEAKQWAEAGIPPLVDPYQFFTAGLNGRLGFKPSLMGKHLTSISPIKRGHDDRLWRYQDGVYIPDGEDWMATKMREFLGDMFQSSYIDETRTWLRAGPRLKAEPNLKYLNLPNGLLDWKTGKLIPHDPKVDAIIRIPIEWHPDAKAPRFERFLREVMPADAIGLAEEVLGYALYPQNRFQKALMCYGFGGNGKGTYLAVMAGLCGSDNVSAQTLHAIAEDKFAAADIYGKLANIVGDLDARAVERTDGFKMLTGRDPIQAQHKFRDSFKFLSYALLAFSANEIPPSSDQTKGYFDRWIVLPMTNDIRGTEAEEQNLDLVLTTKEMLEGILVIAVKGLQRLMKRDHFDIPQSVRDAGEKMRADLSTVESFISECCRVGEGYSIGKMEWYGGYRRWCIRNGRKAYGSTTAFNRVEQAYPHVTGDERTKHGMVFKGIGADPDSWPSLDYGDR